MLKIGNGLIKTDNDDSFEINIGNKVDNIDELKIKIYDHFIENYKNINYLSDRIMLAPINYNVDYINQEI